MRALPVLFGGVFVAVTALAAPTPTKLVLEKVEKGQVEFLAIGRPSMLKIHGKGVAPEGKFEIQNGTLQGSASFDLTTLDTGISLRNRHMKEKYLETEKFPRATFQLERVSLPGQFHEAQEMTLEKLPFTGKLTLHGVERPIQGEAQVKKKNNLVEVGARFSIKIADYAIPTPGYAGITMADEVNIDVGFSGNAMSPK